MYVGSGSESKGAGRVFRTVDGKESVMEIFDTLKFILWKFLTELNFFNILRLCWIFQKLLKGTLKAFKKNA